MTIDPEARQSAALAHQRMDDHEKHCEERFEQTMRSVEDLHKDISHDHSLERKQIAEINAKISAAMWRMMAMMFAIIMAATGFIIKFLA